MSAQVLYFRYLVFSHMPLHVSSHCMWMLGQEVGYEEMLDKQRIGKKEQPQSWAVSFNLANPSHLDINDGHRCYAFWVRGDPGLNPPSQHWLLFPHVGLAIALVDGVAGSWDGRELHHCTGAAVGMHPRDCLLSLFTTIRSDVVSSEARRQVMCEAMRVRQLWPELYEREWCVGDLLWVRWTAKGAQMSGDLWRRTTAVVRQVGGVDAFGQCRAGQVYVAWYGERSSLNGNQDWLSELELRERVVLAGLLGPPPEAQGAELVGRRLRVYWPGLDSKERRGADRVFAGRVCEYDPETGAHALHYDDGSYVWEELGGELASPFCEERLQLVPY